MTKNPRVLSDTGKSDADERGTTYCRVKGIVPSMLVLKLHYNDLMTFVSHWNISPDFSVASLDMEIPMTDNKKI